MSNIKVISNYEVSLKVELAQALSGWLQNAEFIFVETLKPAQATEQTRGYHDWLLENHNGFIPEVYNSLVEPLRDYEKIEEIRRRGVLFYEIGGDLRIKLPTISTKAGLLKFCKLLKCWELVLETAIKNSKATEELETEFSKQLESLKELLKDIKGVL